jgi:hypothetical protein
VGHLTQENARLTKDSLEDLEVQKRTNEKQSEVQKLLETNVQTLETRIELLEL